MTAAPTEPFLKQIKAKLTGPAAPAHTPASEPVDNGEAYLARASAHLEQGQLQQALAEFSQAIELLGDQRARFAAYFNRALVHRGLGQRAAAAADWG